MYKLAGYGCIYMDVRFNTIMVWRFGAVYHRMS